MLLAKLWVRLDDWNVGKRGIDTSCVRGRSAATRDEPSSLREGFLVSPCARTRDLQPFCAGEGLAWRIFFVKRSFLQ